MLRQPTLNWQGRALVAMSGGVDSTMIAAYLANSGFDIRGISMKLYPNGYTTGKTCCTVDDFNDARIAAEDYNFPYQIVNLEEEFMQAVMAYFASEYIQGRTPSPCIMCNNHLKFDVLLRYLKNLSLDILVTGHYASILENEKTGGYSLYRAEDSAKDQSYYLFGIKKENLPFIRFPLGALSKAEVRAHSLFLNLGTTAKAESQDICFVGNQKYSEVIKKIIKDFAPIPGDILLMGTDIVLNTHEGIHNFTVGQRRGINVTYKEPLYVHSIDPISHTVLVCTKNQLGGNTVRLRDVNLLEDLPSRVYFQGRSRGQSTIAEVEYDEKTKILTLESSEKILPSPGQAGVMYDIETNTRVIGGGWIL